MAVLGRLLVTSAERLDLPDFLSLDSYTAGDFKYLMKSFVGDTKPFVLKGFEVINPNNAIGTQNISIAVANSVVYYPGSSAGPYFHGLEEGNLLAAPLIPELRKNSTNYVYLTLTTVDTAKDTRALWDPDREAGAGGEFTQDVNTQTVLTAEVNVSVSSFPDNTIPICKVVVGSNFITSIQDARDMMFRLGSGGLNPNPLSQYSWRKEPTSTYSRKEPNTTMTNALDPNPFKGGDKNIQSLKEWMDAVMTKLSELGGTTYWYENTSVFNLINVFKDALGTSIKSKGTWAANSITPGLLVWSEDLIIQSTTDAKDAIIRANSKALANNEVMYIERVRGAAINSGSIDVSWFNAVNYVNGQLGSFENLSKGDWVKKASDSDYLNARVEEFYAGVNLSGGVTSPANALSIKLNIPYGGLSESAQAVYSKGIYLLSDISVTDRSNPAIGELGGNFYWLALRSDTIMSVASIVTTRLTCDVSLSDGATAKVTSVTHGLSDGQRIQISNSTNYNGIYSVAVEDADTFYIVLTSGIYADETGVHACYATATTQTRSTANGIVLESANHGFRNDQRITISATTNYNTDTQVFVTGNTTFTFPVASLISTETAAGMMATAASIYVRTDVGPTRLDRGETKSIGEMQTENLMSFIGMENPSELYPNYHIPSNYNALDNQHNFNSTVTDNLNARVSKLTSMMADKAQDKTVASVVKNVIKINNVANGIYRDITVTPKAGQTASFSFIQPSTGYSVSIGMTGTVSLAVNSVAYFTINRNANTTIASLGNLSVSTIASLPIHENIFIFAFRTTGEEVMLWDESNVRKYSNIMEELETEITTIMLPPASSITSGQYFTINSALNTNKYYAWFNKDGAGGDPAPIGKAPIEINIITGNNSIAVALAAHTAINAVLDLDSMNNLNGTITVNCTSTGETTNAANVDVGGAFNISIDTSGSGYPLNFISDGDLLEVAIKKLDAKIAAVALSIPDQAYEEPYSVIAPILSGTTITMPVDTRNLSTVKPYIVGEGQLEIFLNGQYLRLNTDWSEVGSAGAESIHIIILQDLVIDDVLLFRIDNLSVGGSTGGGGGGSGEANTASNVGSGSGVFKTKSGTDLQFRSIVGGAGVVVSQSASEITITSAPTVAAANVHVVSGTNYTALVANDVILVSNSGTNLTLTLPSAVGNIGKIFYIKKIDTNNTLSIKSISNQTLDGVNITSGAYNIVYQYESVTIVSDGAAWFII
ncbi:hypothetical protein UFOVP53_231 [uncultured Caudovirales phage]|uniref:Uncharacterized protein n=1 Tax=uncultured Caudovirales phage TaxID=2100421 RepID=A0A6J5L0A5_9CAUD|nr:hypothetical protein UFOVP53_231 [uncultured Caudovirales phage]